MINLRNICKEIEIAAQETGIFILKESESFDSGRIETKGLNDFVSYVDKESEKMLVEKLSIVLPEAGFVAEEGTSTKRGVKYNWIIDPLDGTTNFLHGMHPYAISIGLMDNDEIIAGIVYEVSGNETFIAWKEGGAWLNGRRIHVSEATKVADSLVATGFPYTDFSHLDKYLECMAYFCKHAQGVRRLGSAAIDLAYVACGRFEAFYEYGLHPWDVAAGILLVREAGGRVSDFSGVEKNIAYVEIIATNGLIFSEFQENVSKFMKK
jgi:myo-inositol-1(or 4)-monophosphatase